jgi:hypothetical protein
MARRHDDQAGGASSRWAHGRREAEIEDNIRALRRYGVLTRTRLAEICGAAHWSDGGFNGALRQAVSSGVVRRLGDDLYAIAERPPDPRT